MDAPKSLDILSIDKNSWIDLYFDVFGMTYHSINYQK